MTVITEPGVYDLPEHEYHADPVPGGSLSHSGAKLILEAPAKYRHDLDAEPTDHGEAKRFGSAAHCAVLNPGDVNDLVAVGEFADYKTKAAQEWKAETIAEGRTPILRKQWTVALEMAKRVHDHPAAAELLDACKERERSLFWQSDGIWKRARVDFMGGAHTSGAHIAGDYKTTTDASVKAIEKSVVNYGYHSQAAHYEEGLISLGPSKDVAFLFIFQEKDPPYLVNVVSLSDELMMIGRQRMERAGRVYRECMQSGVWPGYSDKVERAVAPPWVTIEHEGNLNAWGMAS